MEYKSIQNTICSDSRTDVVYVILIIKRKEEKEYKEKEEEEEALDSI